MALCRFVPEKLEPRALLHGTGFEAFVNFQPASSPAPAGYLVDGGAVFGDRGNGVSFGWDVNNASFARDRNSTLSADQRYDTLTHMNRLGGGTKWELAVPNGTYEVHLVAGDAAAYDSIYAINVEGNDVSIDMSLTSPGCPSGPEIMSEAEQQLKAMPGVGAVAMNLVWSPPWTPERIEPRVRAYLGF